MKTTVKKNRFIAMRNYDGRSIEFVLKRRQLSKKNYWKMGNCPLCKWKL